MHSGLPATLTILPAEADTGIVFVRCGVGGEPDREVRAELPRRHRNRIRRPFSATPTGPLCSTAEHVLAALAGLGIDNAIIEIDGPEVPIMDGSAEPFVAAIDRAGIVTLSVPRRYIQILKPIRVVERRSLWRIAAEFARLPHRARHRLRASADRPPGRGARHRSCDLPPRAVARAHLRLHARRGQALERGLRARRLVREHAGHQREPRCSIPKGCVIADEFARHKALDAIGDLALAGAPLLGTYRSVRGGHKLNHAVLSALMADPSAWMLVDGPEIRPEIRQEAPRRAIRGHADLATGLVAPAFGPDVS